MKTEEYDHIKSLISRYLTGESTDQEERELMSWRDSDENNEKEFEQLKKLFDTAIAPSTIQEIDIDHEWAYLQDQLAKQDSIEKQQSFRWLYAAAAVTLLVIGSLVFIFFTSDELVSIQTAQITKTHTLPDGSEITLNSESVVRYSSDFGREHRLLELEGEAFFSVKADEILPFIVVANELNVRVVGTQFNVRSRQNDSIIEIIVQEGIVSLESATEEERVSAGEKGIYTRKDQSLKKLLNSDANYLSWKTGELVFDNSSLNEVVKTLKSHYNANIKISDDVGKECTITAKFDDQSLESVLKVLESTMGLVLSNSENQIVIVSAECE